MKKSWMAKLREKAGESIGETLVALLISSLALLMLAGAISAASQVITRSKDKVDKYYEEDGNLVKLISGDTITINIFNDDVSQDFPRVCYINKEFASNPVVAYGNVPETIPGG